MVYSTRHHLFTALRCRPTEYTHRNSYSSVKLRRLSTYTIVELHREARQRGVTGRPGQAAVNRSTGGRRETAGSLYLPNDPAGIPNDPCVERALRLSAGRAHPRAHLLRIGAIASADRIQLPVARAAEDPVRAVGVRHGEGRIGRAALAALAGCGRPVLGTPRACACHFFSIQRGAWLSRP